MAQNNLAITTTRIDDGIYESEEPPYRPLPVVYILLLEGLFGMIGNALALQVFAKSRKIHPSGNNQVSFINILLLHQCFIDLFGSAGVMIIYFGNEIAPKEIFTDLTCKLILGGWSVEATVNVSYFNLVYIAIERYQAIVNNANYSSQQRKIAKHAGKVFISMWVVGFLPYAFTAWALSLQAGNGYCYTSFSSVLAKRVVAAVLFVLRTVIPLSILYFCLVNIVKSWTTNIPWHGVNRTVATISAFHLLLTAFPDFAFFAINMGNFIIPANSPTLIYVLRSIYFMRPVVNPLIYASQYKTFFEEFKRMFGMCGCCDAKSRNAPAGSPLPTVLLTSQVRKVPQSPSKISISTDSSKTDIFPNISPLPSEVWGDSDYKILE